MNLFSSFHVNIENTFMFIFILLYLLTDLGRTSQSNHSDRTQHKNNIGRHRKNHPNHINLI